MIIINGLLKVLLMHQVFKERIYVVSPVQSKEELLLTSQKQLSHIFEDGIIYELEVNSEQKDNNVETLKKLGYKKKFEDCWISNVWNIDENSSLVYELFSILAEQYDDLIDIDNNINSYDFLISRTLNLINNGNTTTLDYGCGTGIIKKSKLANSLDSVHGYDFNEKMSDISNARGLNIIKKNSLFLQKKVKFDIVLLNYVLHYGVTYERLRELLDLLNVNGIFAANLHKNYYLNYYRKFFSNLEKNQFIVKEIESTYGQVFLIERLQ